MKYSGHQEYEEHGTKLLSAYGMLIYNSIQIHKYSAVDKSLNTLVVTKTTKIEKLVTPIFFGLPDLSLKSFSVIDTIFEYKSD